MSDLTFGVKLTGEGSSLRGEIVASREELERLKTAAGGTQVETNKLNTSTQKLAEEQHRAAASGKSLSESGGQVAAELFKAAAAAAAYQHVVLKSIDASNDYTAAIMGLASAARFSGEDIDSTLNKASALTADGLMSVSEAALALKNLLSRGFTADQAIEMINRLKDSAAFGKQASLEFGQAVVSATEGLKNENSILVDNAGVTKNVSVMWKEYAAQIGVTVEKLTQAQKREAEYSGLMRETEGQMGNSALAADSLMGATARMNKATNDTAILFGQALTPAATALADGLSWASENAVKPMIFGIQGIGIFAGVATEKIGVMAEFLTSPTRWNTAGIANYRKEMRELGELGDQMATELAAKMNGAVQAPNIGKDTGARRKDVVTPDDTGAKLLAEVKKFDDQMVVSHEEAFTKTLIKWRELQDKMIAAGTYGAKERQAHEAAYTGFVNDEIAKREAAANEHTTKLVAKQNEKFIALQQQADAAGLTEEQRTEAKYQRELADLERDRAAMAKDHNLTLSEIAAFERAKENIRRSSQAAKEREAQSAFAQDLKTLGGYSKAFLTAYKIVAVAEIMGAGSVRAEKAAAWAATWGGPAAAAAAFGISWTATLANAAMAGGYLGGGGGGGGGGVSVPSPSDSPSSPGAPASPSTPPPPEQPLQITIYNTGNVLSDDYIESNVISKIQDVVKNKDVLLIDPRSRQASVLQR